MDRLTFSDERLMTLAAGGDQQAFQALVRRMGSAILTVTTRMLGNETAAEEAFVDVVSKLWMGRGTYKGGRPVRPWLMSIAANACRERLRHAWRISPQEHFDEASGRHGQSIPSPDAAMSGEERSARLAAALARLPDSQREVLVLRVWGELKYEHIAEAIGVSEGTARSSMFHAIASMRRMLGSLREFDGEHVSGISDKRSAAQTRSDHQ